MLLLINHCLCQDSVFVRSDGFIARKYITSSHASTEDIAAAGAFGRETVPCHLQRGNDYLREPV